MPIPAFEQHGFLPAGVHDCTLGEIKAVFGTFQGSERRPRLFANLEAFIAEAAASGIVRSVIVDGSFVTATKRPNDIDLIVVVDAGHDFSSDLSPREYNLLSKHRVRRRFGFDLLLAREGSVECDRWVKFF